MAEKIPQKEFEILLEVYRQRYEHIRHLQQMRATYFNLYIAVIGFGIAAIVNIYSDLASLPPQAAISLGSLIWIISILTMMRAERWGGHINHDLHAIREIQNVFASNFKAFADVIPFNPTPLKTFEFDRPLWNRNRSIETPTSVLGAIISATFIALSLPLPYWAQLSSGTLLVILSIFLWRSEVSNLKKRHVKCCMRQTRIPQNPNTTESNIEAG
jgi:membrane protein implicated in regulation of membrane protease activity